MTNPKILLYATILFLALAAGTPLPKVPLLILVGGIGSYSILCKLFLHQYSLNSEELVKSKLAMIVFPIISLLILSIIFSHKKTKSEL
jgi:hypothetical protein